MLKKVFCRLKRDEYSRSNLIREITLATKNRNSENHPFIAAVLNDKMDNYLKKLEKLIENIESSLEGNVIKAAEQNVMQKVDEIRGFVSRLSSTEFSFDVERVRRELIDIEHYIREQLHAYLERQRNVFTENVGSAFSAHFDDGIGLIGDIESKLKVERNLGWAENRLRKKYGKDSVEGSRSAEDDLLKMIKTYKDDFRVLFQALFDAQKEEHNLVLQLDYFIRFVREAKLDYHAKKTKQVQRYHLTRLTGLRERLRAHIVQNRNTMAELRSFEINMTDTLEKSKSITTQPFDVNGLNGKRYYINRSNKGILLLGGNSTSYRQYEPIIYRLVYDGYEVFTVDLPYHGESANVRRKIGFMSRCVYDAVMLMRNEEIVHIGFVGQSLGAIVGLHALIGYDEALEGYLMNTATELLDKMKVKFKKEKRWVNLARHLERNEKLTEEDVELIRDIIRLNDMYNDYKENIVQALERTRFNKLEGKTSAVGLIDAMVILGPPFSIQGANIVPPKLIGVPRFVKWCLHILVNLPMYYNTNFKKDLVPYTDLKLSRKEIVMGFLRIPYSGFARFIKYLLDVPNPFEVMQIINFYATAGKDGEDVFFKYMRDKFIKRIPKFFIYGEKDEYLKVRKSRALVQQAYNMYLGPNSPQPKELPNVAHHFEASVVPLFGFDKRGRKARPAYIQDDIIHFFRQYLGEASRVRISNQDKFSL